MKNIVILFVLSTILNSCKTYQKDKVSNTKAQFEDKTLNADKLMIDLEEYSIIINEYTTINSKYSINKDTVVIAEKLGYTFENKLVQIKPKVNTDKYDVFMALEGKVTVFTGENEMIEQDLRGWVKIEDYQRLKLNTSLSFNTIAYNVDIKKKKLKEYVNELKKELLKIEGVYSKDEIIKAKTLDELPVEYWISRSFLKIIRTPIKGEKEEIIIINHSSLGC